MSLKTSKQQLIKRLQNKKDLESFITKIENIYNWVNDNPTNSDNHSFSPVKEQIRSHIAAAWEGF